MKPGQILLCGCRPSTMFWAWRGTPVSHVDFHCLEKLHEEVQDIFDKYICPTCKQNKPRGDQ